MCVSESDQTRTEEDVIASSQTGQNNVDAIVNDDKKVVTATPVKVVEEEEKKDDIPTGKEVWLIAINDCSPWVLATL